MCWYSLPRQALSVPRQCGGSVLNSRFIVMGGGAGGSPAPPPYLGERIERIGFVGTFRLGGAPKSVLKVGFHRGGMTTPTCRHSYPGVVRRCGCCTCGSSVMASFAGSSLALTRQPGVRHPTSTSARTPRRHRDGPQQHRKATAGWFIGSS